MVEAPKLAMRDFVGTEILSLHGAYHGMSLATMSPAGIAPDRAWFPGAVRWPTFRQVPNADTYRNPLGDGPDAWRASVRALENALDGGYRQVAALVMEEPSRARAARRLSARVLPRGPTRPPRARCAADRRRDPDGHGPLRRCGVRELFDVRPTCSPPEVIMAACPWVLVAGDGLVSEEIEAEPWNILTFMNQPLAVPRAWLSWTWSRTSGWSSAPATSAPGADSRALELAGRFEVVGDVRGPGLFVGIDYVLDRDCKTAATAACAEARATSTTACSASSAASTATSWSAAAHHPGRRLRADARPGGRRDRVHPAVRARPRQCRWQRPERTHMAKRVIRSDQGAPVVAGAYSQGWQAGGLPRGPAPG